MASKKINDFTPSEIGNLKYFEIFSNLIIKNIVNGLHQSPFSGHSIEFKDYRKYQYGDDFKKIDWKLYARTDKLFIKKFEKKVNVDIHIFLDNSNSMYFGEKVSKLIYGKYLTAILTGIALKQNNNVFLYSFNDSIYKFSKKLSNFSSINIAYNRLKQIKASERTNFSNLRQKIKKINNSIIFIISDFWGDLDNIIDIGKYGRVDKNELNYFHILSNKEQKFNFNGSYEFIDSEKKSREIFSVKQIKKYYLDRLKERINTLKKEINSQNNNYLLLNNRDNLYSILYKYFMNR
ncbi:MAG: DUF58 domain-containing protein [Candidatus Mcinerneyibacterium aminivorans]|uniref:DUF58 domain-containing protein n=1 Tax=Candidatus Mcinerneyibacterium aminivorans TaxID=2703815 RepID=A0A5D0MG50_9BACT|nr:MAG: DUF58 domain-containing protein [Candidatus Mcinerneyibacterium aminivorans]